MKHIMITLLTMSSLYCNISLGKVAGNEDPKKVKASLTKVQNEIQRLEKTLYQTQDEERALIQHLAGIEKEIGEQSDKLRQLEQTIQAHQATLANLQKQQIELQISHQNQLSALAQLVNNSYQHQNKEKIQLLLEPKEWSTLTRINEYYRRFYQARAEHVRELKNDVVQLQLLQEPLLREQQAITDLAHSIQEQQKKLAHQKDERLAVLSKLASERHSTQTQLSQLQLQEEHLAKVFKTLENKLRVTPTYIEPIHDFSKMKHKLKLPIEHSQAVLSLIPHAKKSGSKKTYIEASAGTPVNAIFAGQVVFAEWLRGVGLLIILDHGNGYMTLYGNNQKLYKSLGDTVNQGEMIARVGESGGHAKPGLYFEIRKDGEALDPTPWFEKK